MKLMELYKEITNIFNGLEFFIKTYDEYSSFTKELKKNLENSIETLKIDVNNNLVKYYICRVILWMNPRTIKQQIILYRSTLLKNI